MSDKCSDLALARRERQMPTVKCNDGAATDWYDRWATHYEKQALVKPLWQQVQMEGMQWVVVSDNATRT